MARDSELERIYRQLRQLHYGKRMGKGHWKIYDPAGRMIAVGPSTPGDSRAAKNLRSDLRRAGVPI